MPVQFHNEIAVTLNNRKALKAFIKTIFESEGRSLENLQVIFCSDAYLLTINRQFLNHNDYTDIITFDLSETTDRIIGELYISIERVKENALKLNQDLTKELHRVIFHGILHLCGYSDKTPKEITVMRKKEDLYLQRYDP